MASKVVKLVYEIMADTAKQSDAIESAVELREAVAAAK